MLGSFVFEAATRVPVLDAGFRASSASLLKLAQVEVANRWGVRVEDVSFGGT